MHKEYIEYSKEIEKNIIEAHINGTSKTDTGLNIVRDDLIDIYDNTKFVPLKYLWYADLNGTTVLVKSLVINTNVLFGNITAEVSPTGFDSNSIFVTLKLTDLHFVENFNNKQMRDSLIISLYNSGVEAYTIGKIFGLTTTTVKYALSKAGVYVDKGKPGRRPTTH